MARTEIQSKIQIKILQVASQQRFHKITFFTFVFINIVDINIEGNR